MKYYTVKQISELYPAFSELSLRWLIFKKHTNGFINCVRKIGKKVIINQEDFEKWIEDHKDIDKNIIIKSLKLTTRTKRRLADDKIFTIGDLLSKTEMDLLNIPGLGIKSFREIEQYLSEHKLNLREI